MAEASGRNFTINDEPQHPAAQRVLLFVVELGGEVEERADPHSGLLYRTGRLIKGQTHLLICIS
jgi:NADH-quinone oxidoreductase subunit D